MAEALVVAVLSFSSEISPTVLPSRLQRGLVAVCELRQSDCTDGTIERRVPQPKPAKVRKQRPQAYTSELTGLPVGSSFTAATKQSLDRLALARW